MEIKLVPIDQVKPYPNNPRKNDKAVADVVQSTQKPPPLCKACCLNGMVG